MTQFVHIYTLSNPITNSVCYIGKTNILLRRLSEHIRDANKKVRTHKSNWINSLLKNNMRPRIEILDTVLEKEWEFWEQYYVSLFKSWGFKLTNGDNGGQGGKNHSLEAKQKMSKARKGKKHSKKHRENISLALKGKGKGRTPWNKGKKHSEKTKAKISIKAKTRAKNPKFRKKLSILRIGKILSQKQIKNISLVHKGKKISNATKQKITKSVALTKAKESYKLLQLDINNELVSQWNTVSEAALFYNVSNSAIRKVCRGEHKTCKGFKWKYQTLKSQTKKIVQLSLNNEPIRQWDSLAEAAQGVGIAYNNISRCCRGKQHTAKGFKWKFCR